MKRNNQLPLLKNIQFAKQMWNCYHIFIFATTKSLSVRHNTTKHKMCKERKKNTKKIKTVTTVTKKQTVII
jgi:hypothetical protein